VTVQRDMRPNPFIKEVNQRSVSIEEEKENLRVTLRKPAPQNNDDSPSVDHFAYDDKSNKGSDGKKSSSRTRDLNASNNQRTREFGRNVGNEFGSNGKSNSCHEFANSERRVPQQEYSDIRKNLNNQEASDSLAKLKQAFMGSMLNALDTNDEAALKELIAQAETNGWENEFDVEIARQRVVQETNAI
jgi:hypothetical protein